MAKLEGATVKPPTVFLCHAFEDKARFVKPFAEALLAKGVGVFYDDWDIGLGDRLWERISDGIDESDAFVLVASRKSLARPWVKEEVGGGMHAKLKAGKLFVPIVLDDCADALPTLLKGMRYLEVPDTNDFSEALSTLVERLHGVTSKPPVAAAPMYAKAPDPPPGLDLTRADWMVLRLLAEHTLTEDCGFVDDGPCHDIRTRSGLSNDGFTNSLEALNELGMVELHKSIGQGPLGRGIHHVSVTISGFETYLEAAENGYQETKQRALAAIVNGDGCSGTDIRAAAGCSARIARHIAEWVEDQGLAKASFNCGPDAPYSVYLPSVRLRRMVEG